MRLFSGPDKAKFLVDYLQDFSIYPRICPHSRRTWAAGGITPGSSRALRVADLDL